MNKAAWMFSALAVGAYEVFATWVPYDDAGNYRATNAPYSVRDGGAVLATVRVNQEVDPVGPTADGAVWESLGTYVIDSGTLVVELSDDADDWVVADGVRVVSLG